MSHLNSNGLFDGVWKDASCQAVCEWLHMHNPVKRSGKYVLGDFLNLEERLGRVGEGRGVQRHFPKLLSFCWLMKGLCSVFVACMLKFLHEVFGLFSDFRCGCTQVVWCLSALVLLGSWRSSGTIVDVWLWYEQRQWAYRNNGKFVRVIKLICVKGTLLRILLLHIIKF